MLLRLFLVLATVITVILDVILPQLIPWSILLVFSFWILLIFFSILYLFIVSLFCYGKKPLEKDNSYCRYLAYHTMDCILTLFRFRVRGEGLEKIPEEPCILVCNHLSRFDPMAAFLLMKGCRLGFVSKKENMKIPIVGPITQKIGFVPLDRENPLRAMRAIRYAARLVSEKGFTMGIYPEGTRSRTGKLLEFKTGAFVLAKKSSAPIAVCRISGTNEFKKNLPLRKTPVLFEVLDVIPKEEVKETSPEDLAEICRTKIEEM